MPMTKKYSSGEDKEKTSLFINKDIMRTLKYISFINQRTQTEIINEVLGEFVAKWEKKNGPVPPQKA
jgi:hypothetical protein